MLQSQEMWRGILGLNACQGFMCFGKSLQEISTFSVRKKSIYSAHPSYDFQVKENNSVDQTQQETKSFEVQNPLQRMRRLLVVAVATKEVGNGTQVVNKIRLRLAVIFCPILQQLFKGIYIFLDIFKKSFLCKNKTEKRISVRDHELNFSNQIKLE